ncbi:MAG: sulfite exporter TauE/SafE family protein [Woeseiaceae bacterium]
MTELWPLLSAAFITGLLGSAHCFGMCGGISGLFAVHASVGALRHQLPKAVAYNLGRILTYAILGVAVALLGKSLVASIPKLAAPVRFASGTLIILVGLQLAFGWRILAPVERAGASLWKKVAPAAQGLVPVESVAQALGLGLLWGCLPCGLVYSVLLLAATTAEPASGGLVMIAFGLGTMPAMVATGLSASRLARFMGGQRFGAGLLIILIGIATIAMPVMKFASSDADMQHGNHSMSPQRQPAD